MKEKTMGEIYLEPEEEIIKNAKEIAEESQNAEKYIFCISYEATEKSVVLSEIKRLECEILEQSDTKTCVMVKASMAQLAAIKSLNCIEKVEMADDYSATITEDVSEIMTANELEATEFTEHVSLAAMEEETISTMCYGGDSGSDCDNSNTMQTAYYLPISSWVNGCICCPGTEIWYRFTASASNAAEYTIYTSGSLDTMGYLYSSNGTLITSNDDGGTNMNFSITRALTYGATYYICVRAYGSNTGNFSLRVDYTTSSSSGNDNSDDGSNDMSTAITLPLSTYVSGSIDCPCAEKWYRFTASNSNASQYTIYTSGSLDTVGYLYNSNGTLITSNDDSGVNMNFSITRALTYGATYYLKVKAYGSKTGSYNVRVDYETSSTEPDDNDCSNEMSSAINLGLNSWQGGEICCPGAEIWYKFTPSSTAYYTIYTVGSLDTYGYLYDANGTEIDYDDDDGSGLNFKMVQPLTAGQTYYIKAKAFGSNTGYFSIAVTNTVFVETVSINKSYIALDKGKTEDLDATVTPSNATNPTLRWETGDASVATVNQDGVVTARGAGTTCICAYSQDGSNKSSCCEVSVNVPVETVTINTSSLLMRVGEEDDLDAKICPPDAVNKLIRWTSTDSSIVWVNEATGKVKARGVGSVTIYATAQDGTGVRGSCAIQVEPPIPVQGIDICCETATMNVGETTKLSYDIYPSDATNKTVVWCSSNRNVAEIDSSTGRITAKLAGTTTITVTTGDGCFVDSCELWVHGKTPVFLIHGRISNSFDVWGAGNRIFVNPMDISEADNNHYNSSINALSQGNVQYLYTNKNVQDIFGYQTGQTIKVDGTNVVNFTMPGVFNGQFDDGKYTSEHPEGGNLAYYLKSNGYKENINLFVFNYPNEDAVVHSANKFKKYIENLISYVRTSGTNEMKACFYASKCDYIEQNHKINLVGHSMGGLVSRYYVENLGQDNHVDKLITICTPHWGSNLADYSTSLSIKHVLCDHDLDPDSEMYGGKNKDVLHNGCPLWDITDLWTNCTDVEYETTQELLYSGNRETKYYAIAGLDYTADYLPKKDNEFDMSTNFVTYQQISDFMFQNKVYKLSGKDSQIINKIDFKNEGDNVVPFLSQIGWTNNSGDSPHKRIQMEKILVIVDADGGNNLVSHLHGKIPHRNCVMENIMLFLSE